MNTSYILKVEYNENTDEYYIILPEKLLKELSWNTGDKIKWTKRKDSFVLRKID